MALQQINNGETGLAARTKINAAIAEVDKTQSDVTKNKEDIATLKTDVKSASDAAAYAQGTADSALAKANLAKQGVDEVFPIANEAARIANEAKSTADTAQQTANNKQNKLIAGENIEIINNVISSTAGEIGGENVIFVRGGGTKGENGSELEIALVRAAEQGNGVTVVIMPGEYLMALGYDLELYDVNITSLTGECICKVNYAGRNYPFSLGAGCTCIGIDTGDQEFRVLDYADIVVKNCKGGAYSFGRFGASGTFINCECTSAQGFGGSGNYSSGTFIDCKGYNDAFSTNGGNSSGKFVNCTCIAGGFGNNGIASGYFYNCKSGYYGFGSNGIASGTFVLCESGSGSFGSGYGSSNPGTASGKFYHCMAKDSIPSFGGGNGKVDNTAIFSHCESEYISGLSASTMKARNFCIENNVALENLTN